MREIEIKARIKDKAALLERLQANGVNLGQPLKQHDVVYGQPGAKGGEKDVAWLRIRTENDTKTILTLKKSVTSQLDSIEHETEVVDAQETEKIILALGFELYSDLTKIRQKAFSDNIEYCVDELPGIGVFIELEKITSVDADGAKVVDRLWQMLEDLGISKDDEVLVGYDVLERQQRLSTSEVIQ